MNTNPPTTEQTAAIHKQYCCLTGLQVPYTMTQHFMWESFLAAGFTEPDLAVVVRHLKKKIREGKRPKESLLPRNIIQRIDFFGEDLAIAKAEAKPRETPRQEILRAVHRTEPLKEPVKAGDVMAAGKAFDAFKAWRDANL